MVASGLLVILAIGVLLVPELRADGWSWLFALLLVVLAVANLVVRGDGSATLLTSRQVRFRRSGGWGFTSRDGAGERDAREKRGR